MARLSARRSTRAAQGPAPWATALALALMLLALAPSVRGGWAVDDLSQRAMVQNRYAGARTPWELYAFAPADPAVHAEHLRLGTLPWWTQPQFRFALARPLASALRYGEEWLWPAAPWWMHVHALAWVAAMLVAGAAVLRAARVPATIAALALALWAVDASMVSPGCWLAARGVAVAGVFGCLAVALHLRAHPLRARDGASPPPATAKPALLEAGAWCLALGGGAYGLSAMGYVVAHTLVRAGASVRARALALVPALGPGCAFIGLHAAAGAGVRHGGDFAVIHVGGYADPGAQPWTFLQALAVRLPRAWLELWTGLPAEDHELAPLLARAADGLGAAALAGWVRTPGSARAWGFAAAGLAVALIVMGAALWSARARGIAADRARGARAGDVEAGGAELGAPSLAVFVAGSALAIVPLSAAPMSARLLALPALGIAVAIAAAIVGAARSARAQLGPPRARLAAAVIAAALLLGHGPLQWLRTRAAAIEATAVTDASWTAIAARIGAPPARLLDGRHVVLLGTATPALALHGVAASTLPGAPALRSWHAISLGPRPLLLRRTGERELELSAVGGGWLTSADERFFAPDPARPVAGEQVDAGPIAIEVLAGDPGEPRALRLRWSGDAPLWLHSRGLELEPVALPPIGGVIALPRPALPGPGGARPRPATAALP